MDTTDRLRLATRVHFGLLRHYAADVGVGTLLRGGRATDEALWVCEASEDAELAALGRQLGHLLRAEAAAQVRALRDEASRAHADAPQDALWARDTSGFGVTWAGGDLPEPAGAPASGWFSAARWRKLGVGSLRR